MADTVLSPAVDLAARFPNWVQPDTRPGYQGYLVEAVHLAEFARKLRDELGYDYLSSVTGVDYLPNDRMEVVYHASRIAGGPNLVFKAQVPRDHAV